MFGIFVERAVFFAVEVQQGIFIAFAVLGVEEAISGWGQVFIGQLLLGVITRKTPARVHSRELKTDGKTCAVGVV